MYCNHKCPCQSNICPNARVFYKPTSLDDLALEVIKGNYGNGETRKRLLGDLYEPVQDRVNQFYNRY